MNDCTFTIDIGTRKIAAFIALRQGEVLEIAAGRIVEHKSRAVRAGQIHDIERVSAMIRDIKDSLQKETGRELKKVATAIAGRNLKCYRASGETHLDGAREIGADDMRQAELAAIQSVIGTIGPEIDEYYFVGHTTIRWLIDGEPISHPLGHYAQSLAVEMITTFLPRKVLESLFSVMRKADLEVSYLTLEPIAAAEAVFPQDMRHL
ncbi:MAG: cell division protein FtsA, partial [Endomicrobiales bacterium]